MKTYNTRAIVLGVCDYKERDKIISLLTPDQGRFDVVARGTKRITSKLNGHLETGNVCEMMIAKGKGYDVLANAFIHTTHPSSFRENVGAHTAQKLMIEILNNLVLIRIPDASIFELLQNSLAHVHSVCDDVDTDYESLVHVFSVKLLDILGYRPELTRCTQCLRGIIAPHAVIDVRAGGLLCSDCAPQKLPEYAHTLSDSAIKLLLLTLDEHFETLKNYRFGLHEQTEFKKIARQLLTYQLSKPLLALDAFKGL